MRQLASRGFAWVPGLTRTSGAHAADDRFSDEEILTVVRAGEAGLKLAALCQATGITVDTYYAWKARYGGLTAAQLHALRARTRTRHRRLQSLVGAIALVIVGNGLLMVYRSSLTPATPMAAFTAIPVLAAGAAPIPVTHNASPALPTDAPAGAGTAAAAATTGPAATSPADAAKARPPAVPAPAAASSAPAREPYADMLSADPAAFSVQVAAVPDLAQAQDALQKLARAGYPAHLTTKTVNGKAMFRIRVGPLRSRQLADEIAVRLKKDGYSTPWVTH